MYGSMQYFYRGTQLILIWHLSLLLPLSIYKNAASKKGYAVAFTFGPSIATGAHRKNSNLIRYKNFHLQMETDDQEFDENMDEPKIQTFAKLGMTPTFQQCAKKMGWTNPTPIQKLTIPAILQLGGKKNLENEETYNSIWSEAPTGSGKTGGYALPLVQLITQHNRQLQIEKNRSPSNENGENGKVTALILVPTRELAMQINWVFQDLNDALPKKYESNKLHHLVIHGGVPLEPQIQAMASCRKTGAGVDVLIATPGRLVDVLLHYTKQDTGNSAKGRKKKSPKMDDIDLEKAADAALERKLLAALDNTGKRDTSLTLQDLMDAKLDRIDSEETDGRDLISDMLDSLKYLVIDEADRLLGQPFQKELDPLLQLLPSWSRKMNDDEDYSKDLVTMKSMLFSATFPEQIQPRVEKILERLHGREFPPLRLSCTETSDEFNEITSDTTTSHDEKKSKKGKNKYPPLMPTSTSTTGTISLRTIRIEEKHRTSALKNILNENPHWDRVLVFVATRYASEHVARKLRRANISSTELHGKLDQDARTRRLEQFRRGKTRVLLATDLASRGLDIMGLPAVVNYDLPRSTADFTHRIGRTGRAGRKGEAVTFCTPRNEAHLDLIERRQFSKDMVLPQREILEGFEVDEVRWGVEANASRMSVPGAKHSGMGLAFDKMHGGVKGRRPSKKDKLREKALRESMKE